METEQPRKSNGTYTMKGMNKWEIRIILFVVLMCATYLLGTFITIKFTPSEITATAHADTRSPELKGLTIEQLENKLDAIVWGVESTGKVGKGLTMEEGEIFPTFDPSKAMYAQCIKIGGKQPKDCLSYGPRQEKIGTIEYYWPKLHDGATITDSDARDVAENNQNSKRFFLDCSVQIKGCADNWTSFSNHKTEGQIYLDLIREAKGITI